MNMTEFLAGLIQRGVQFQVSGDQLTLRAPKNSLTPEERAELGQVKAQLLSLLRSYSANSMALYPLAIGQRALWFLYQLAPESTAYNIMTAFKLGPEVDLPALQAAFEALIERHSCLRTTFPEIGGQPAQLVHASGQLHFKITEAAGWSDDQLEQQIAEAANQPFDLAQGPVLRLNLFTRPAAETILTLTVHHIAFDFWSLELLLDELPRLYEAAINKRQAALPLLPLQFSDYVRWQTEMLAGPKGQQLWSYWQQQLSGQLPALDLPTDRPRPSVQTYKGTSDVSLALDNGLAQRLKALAQAEGTTLYTTLLAAYQVLLYRYTAQEDILVGSPLVGRSQADFERIVGYFVNPVVMRAKPAGHLAFTAFLKQVSQMVLGALEHADYPFPLLVEKLQSERDPSRSPIFQVAFIWDKSRQLEDEAETQLGASGEGDGLPLVPKRSLGTKEKVREGDTLKLEPIAGGQRGAEVDLLLTIFEQENSLSALWRYNTDLFDNATISRMAGHFQALLESIVAQPEQQLSALSLLTAIERHQLLVEWNSTQADFPQQQCFHNLFEAHAARQPEAIALIFEGQTLTYQALNGRANQLAHRLQGLGVGPGVLVGVCLERSLEMIIGLLGVLKAGGAYVPLDPAYPQDRLAFMLADAKIPVLLSQVSVAERLPEHGAQVICLDRDWPEIAQEPETTPGGGATPDHPAYVIYTSGSTGRPKGVLVGHRGLSNICEAQLRLFGVGPGDRVLQFSSLSFDASTFEMCMALGSGATLCLGRVESLMPGPPLLKFLKELEITIFTLTPSSLLAVPVEPLPALHTITVAGEACPSELIERWAAGRRFFNLYGPTETTIWATYATCTDSRQKPPIGQPIINTQLYILDPQLAPVPLGLPGELYIGGVGVSLGYLNRPELTEEKFISDPFSQRAGGRLYKTGDLARYLPDGNLEFLGRIDHQVKIRGFRIELGEIESALKQHPAVQEVIVVAREELSGEKRLVAYLVVPQEPPPSVRELRSLLQERLPEYMVPAAFVLLKALPITPNGKIDRQALPPPEDAQLSLGVNYIAPQSQIEQTIASVWQEVLELEQVGIYDNFFDIGGHSLAIIQVLDKLRRVLEVDLSVADMFQYSTIEALAKYLTQSPNGAAQPLNQGRQALRTGAEARLTSPEIAIVGLASRFPQAKNVEAFWQNLQEGVEAISRFSDEELVAAGVSPALLAQPNYVKANGMLEEATMFDASFFGFSPQEATVIDPQHRVFLECAWEALENAGYDPERYPGAIGVYAGSSMNTYLWYSLAANHGSLEPAGVYRLAFGNDKDFLPTRVSYKLNLKGISVSVQTACSTSLVAVHLACQGLLQGQCDMALAGGVSITMPQKRGYLYQEGMILSPDGHCRAFDAQAQGTIPGEGVGIVVLKRLEDALAAGDTIHAVIKGSASNNDGASKVGYTAPSVAGEVEVITQAQAAAGVEPETITYIEAHGTATPLGDPTEIAALTQVFQNRTSKTGFCAIGSVKSNLGHLDAAAGVASLIKTVLALKHKQLPPSLHYERPNPEIDFARTPFYVNAQLREWQTEAGPRRAGVSSFGIGGTNAHVVLEEAPPVKTALSDRPWHLLLLSAKTESAVEVMGQNLAAYLQAHPQVNLADVAYTLQVGRAMFNYRRLVVCRDREEAIEALEGLAPASVLKGVQEAKERPVVFMFPGQGAQYVQMAAGLYEFEPVFRTNLDRCAELLEPLLSLDLCETLYPGEEQEPAAQEQLRQTQITQPALFAVEYALAQLWQSWGVQPQALIGHSIGELVAACLAGVFSLEEALTLVAARGRLMQSLPEGAMLAVSLPENEVRDLLGQELSLAVINGPSRCVVAGPTGAIERLQAQLLAQKVQCGRLQTSHAFHSTMMEPILAAFIEQVQQLNLKPPQLPFISNVTGTWITAAEATDPSYWARQLRQTVRFADGLATLFAGPDWLLLEVGPGQTLTTLARQHPAKAASQRLLASLRHPHDPQPDVAFLLKTLGQLWLAGVKIDWPGLYGETQPRRLPLPTYPFERQQYLIEPSHPVAHPQPLAKKPEMADWFYVPSWKRAIAPPVLAPAEPAKQKLHWLIFSDDNGLGPGLVKRLEQLGQEIIRVQIGDEFSRVSENLYTLNPQRWADYDRLLAELRRWDQAPQKIIHLWNVTPNGCAGSGLAGLNEVQDRGFYSLLALAQAVGNHFSHEIQVGVVTNHLHEVTGAERLSPEKATVLGACKIIPEEYSNLNCRNIDIILPESEEEQENLIAQLLAELSDPSVERICAYRGVHRWVQIFEPVHLPEAAAGVSRVKAGGVYLITGGLGGIGLVLAEHLAKVAQARLILTGRSTFPARERWAQWLADHDEQDETSRKIRKLEALEALGAEVLPLMADVANLEQMEAVIAQAQARFGPVNGVIHAAGLPDHAGIIQRRDREATEQVLAPKVRGTLVLETVLKRAPLDFFVLCSTLGSLLPRVEFGEVGYCAANEFLDAFAYDRSCRESQFTVTINWTSWQEVGMSVAAAQRWTETHQIPQELQAILANGLKPAEGVAVFERIVAGRFPRVVVSPQPLMSVVEQAVSLKSLDLGELSPETPASKPTHPRPSLNNVYTAPRNQLEVSLAGIWQTLLGVEPVGINDNFFELGGDSLLVIQAHNRLQVQLGAKLSIGEMFQYPTISMLAKHLAQEQEDMACDKAQDKPFDEVQERPFNGAQDKPAEQVRTRAERQRLALAQQGQRMMKKKRSQ